MTQPLAFMAKVSTGQKKPRYGTAVLVSPTHALTCRHVLGATMGTEITLEFPGFTATGRSGAGLCDDANDLALVEFETAHPGPVPSWTDRISLDSAGLKAAAWPWDEKAKEQRWLYGGFRVNSVNTLDTQVQLSLNSGASGGVILDTRGYCAGVLNLGNFAADHSKAIPAHVVHEFLTAHNIAHEYDAKPGGPDCAERYREYLREKTCHIDLGNLLAERGRREIPRLDEFYATLTTRIQAPGGEKKKGAGREEPQSVPLQSLLLEHRRVLLRGDAGCGKTTFLRRAAWALCRPDRAEDSLQLPCSGLPLFIRVRDLDNYIEKAIGKPGRPDRWEDPLWIGHLLASQVPGVEPEFFQGHLTDPDSVLLIDGLDEAAGSTRRKHIAELVQRALPKNGCHCVVTTRPAIGNDGASLTGLTLADIDPLVPGDIDSFLENWCLWYEEGRRANLESYLPRLQRAVSRRELKPLAGNPLMLTLMAIVCQIKQKQLPERRADVYKEVAGYLADLSERRDGESRPDQRAQYKARKTIQRLQTLAWKMQTGEEPFTKHTLRATESEATMALTDRWTSPAQAEDFVLFAQRDSGILTLRDEHLEFWHRSFQEYLAAVRLTEGLDWGAAARLLFDNESRDVLVLAAGCIADGSDALEGLFQAALAATSGRSLAERAIAAGVIHKVRSILDEDYLKLTETGAAYRELLDSIKPIFTEPLIPGLSIKDRAAAAEAIGNAHPLLFTPDQGDYWIPIAGGAYTIGLTEAEERRFEVKARRRTGVARPFFIGRYPATVREYEEFLADPSTKTKEPYQWDEQVKHPTWPVTGVSWHDAAAYCEWASKRSGWKIRLPEEHEWEIAARGLRGERQFPWPDGEPSPEKANYSATRIGQPTPVGIFPAGNTPDGIADMAGNVLEWTASDYDDDSIVLRGGSFNNFARVLRAAFRVRLGPGFSYYNLGFRCLRE